MATPERGRDHERGFFDRATDEVSSWFGDRDAERRREMDHRGRGPKGYQRSDSRVQDDVSDRLADDRYLDATDIEVTVSNGEVTLAGSVDSRDARRRAEDLAEQVSGVSYVQNNLGRLVAKWTVGRRLDPRPAGRRPRREHRITHDRCHIERRGLSRSAIAGTPAPARASSVTVPTATSRNRRPSVRQSA